MGAFTYRQVYPLFSIEIDGGPCASSIVYQFSERSRYLGILSVSADAVLQGGKAVITAERDRDARLLLPESYQDGERLINTTLLRVVTASVCARAIRERVLPLYLKLAGALKWPSYSEETRAVAARDAIAMCLAAETVEAQYFVGDLLQAGDNAGMSEALRLDQTGSVSVDTVFLGFLGYVALTDSVSLSSVVRFRLGGLLKRLIDYLSRSMIAQDIQEEYTELIRVCQRNLRVQTSQRTLVYVVRDSGGSLRLYDGSGDNLDLASLSDDLSALKGEEADTEDILISILMALSPDAIVLCMKDSEALFPDLVKLISPRLVLCDGCTICHLNQE